ncbi:hypothetical protein D5086_026352 [Populus alba]|uniref:Uncharacterized protein n=1 Tax=Populus alba TaxID=43335 RepID=A0ACC4B3D9_POPAL
MMMNKETSHWWWFDIHHTSSGSPWLQSTLAELDRKTKSMLKLIEADADSFAQRAEMYYKKRPELISMVEDFYKAHRLLAERHDQLKSDSGNRLLATFGSPFSTKHRPEKLMSVKTDQTYDSHSETCESEDSAGSEKDEEKREVIRQLSLAVEVLKLENVKLRKCVANQNRSHFSVEKLKDVFRGKLFNGSSKSQSPDEVVETEEEAGKDPDGEIENLAGPGATMSLGFGGLGLEGMVGRDDSVGEGAPAPGVGSKGSISGDEVGGEDKGATGKNAGAADIVEIRACI